MVVKVQIFWVCHKNLNETPTLLSKNKQLQKSHRVMFTFSKAENYRTFTSLPCNNICTRYLGNSISVWLSLILFFQVRLETNSHGIFSTRGILAEFWPLGCATPTDPGNGYLHIRNHTHANYVCHGGYVFQDTLERTKTLICDDQRGHWYDTMAVNCVSLQYLRWLLF